MMKNSTAMSRVRGMLVMVCALVFALSSASAFASDRTEKKEAVSPISAYKTTKKTEIVSPASAYKTKKTEIVSPASAYKTKKTEIVSPASAYRKNMPGYREIEEALEFTIPRSMAGKTNAIQWTFGASKIGRPVLSGNHYQLVNLAIEKGLKRQERMFAANLGFEDISTRNFNMLVQRKVGNGQLRYGDVIALNLKPYGWLRYKDQGRFGGINLSDDNHNPHYIWQVTGGKRGTKVYSGMPFALHNIAPQNTEVIFCLRSSGIDLGWRGKSECGGTLAEISGEVFGANGALSGEGLTGKLATEWKGKICKAAVGAASAYVAGQTGGVGAAGVAAAAPVAIKKCKEL